jgi:hypothetical protein
MDKFHVAARLPDAAKAPGQFAQAIAVNEIHAREIDQELLVAVAAKDVNQVAQLSATVSQRESSHNIDHNDAISLSRCDLKTHIGFASWLCRRNHQPEHRYSKVMLTGRPSRYTLKSVPRSNTSVTGASVSGSS